MFGEKCEFGREEALGRSSCSTHSSGPDVSLRHASSWRPDRSLKALGSDRPKSPRACCDYEQIDEGLIGAIRQ